MVLNDGRVIGIAFNNTSNSQYYSRPDILFYVDVNAGFKKTNKIGRDIFYFYLQRNSKGKVMPYTNEDKLAVNSNNNVDTCYTNNTGFSCAYRVITEGKMDY